MRRIPSRILHYYGHYLRLRINDPKLLNRLDDQRAQDGSAACRAFRSYQVLGITPKKLAELDGAQATCATF